MSDKDIDKLQTEIKEIAEESAAGKHVTAEKAKQDMEKLAQQNEAATKHWDKAVRYNKIIRKLREERDTSRSQVRELTAQLEVLQAQQNEAAGKEDASKEDLRDALKEMGRFRLALSKFAKGDWPAGWNTDDRMDYARRVLDGEEDA